MIVKKTTTTVKYDDHDNIVEQTITESIEPTSQDDIVVGEIMEAGGYSPIDMLYSFAAVASIIAACVVIFKCATMG